MAVGARFVWINRQAAVDVVDKKIEEVALQVQRLAKTYAPVDTGTLQASITAARVRADTSGIEWIVGTNVYYAVFQEFGTVHIPPHPFLGKALAAVASQVA